MPLEDWKEEMNSIVRFRRHVKSVLKKIAKRFEATGEEFDEAFRNEFFQSINAA